jgi:hypothetical protein
MFMGAASCSSAHVGGSDDGAHDATGMDAGKREARDGSATLEAAPPADAWPWANLPPCTWPTNILPPVPDGGYGVGYVVRSFHVCGPVESAGGFECDSFGGPDDSFDSPATQTCVLPCGPSEYVVGTAPPPNNFNPDISPDADLVYPVLPPGCGQPVPSFALAYATCTAAEGMPEIACCPCQP